MRRIALFAIAAGFVVPLMASPAHAQATRTWVSGVGDDVNPCSRTAPCKTFAGAISKTAAGGEINCLDPAGFGAVTIIKSMTISCEGVTGGMVVAGGNGVNVSAGANDVVFLKGLDIEGLGMTTGGIGLNGIKINTAAAVHIEDCHIRNFRAATPNGFGILVNPSTNVDLHGHAHHPVQQWNRCHRRRNPGQADLRREYRHDRPCHRQPQRLWNCG